MKKVCKDCKQEKDISEFGVSKGKKRNICKKCHNAKVVEARDLRLRGLRKCRGCHEVKPISKYGKKNTRVCFDCLAKKAAKRLEKKQAKELKEMQKDKKSVDRIYEKMLNHKETLGLSTYPDPEIKDCIYKINWDGEYKRGTRISEGKVIAKTDSFLVLESRKGIRECILINDLKLGEVELKEVSI